MRDYLNSLKWDGIERIGTWLTRYMGAEGSPYVAAIGRMFVIAAVARVYEPGAKADYVVVLEGQQGAGKVARLRSAWCLVYDFPADVTRDKDAAQHLRGKWIIEISELSALWPWCSLRRLNRSFRGPSSATDLPTDAMKSSSRGGSPI